jgi:hypothetical protein
MGLTPREPMTKISVLNIALSGTWWVLAVVSVMVQSIKDRAEENNVLMSKLMGQVIEALKAHTEILFKVTTGENPRKK